MNIFCPPENTSLRGGGEPIGSRLLDFGQFEASAWSSCSGWPRSPRGPPAWRCSRRADSPKKGDVRLGWVERVKRGAQKRRWLGSGFGVTVFPSFLRVYVFKEKRKTEAMLRSDSEKKPPMLGWFLRKFGAANLWRFLKMSLSLWLARLPSIGQGLCKPLPAWQNQQSPFLALLNAFLGPFCKI